MKKTRKKKGSKRRTMKKIENKNRNKNTVYKKNSIMSRQNMNTMVGAGEVPSKKTQSLCNSFQIELFENFTQNIIEHKKNEDILENYFKNGMKEEEEWVDKYYKNVYLKEDRKPRLANVEHKLFNDSSKHTKKGYTQNNTEKKTQKKTQKKLIKKLNKDIKGQ